MTKITIAGRSIDHPAGTISAYAAEHGDTVRKYDLAERGNENVLSPADIDRTRIIFSRISYDEQAWFLGRGQSAPWRAVPASLALTDLDPEQAVDQYAAADALYRHFFRERKGVAVAKVSKVLHVKRPHLFPILDSRVVAIYREQAEDAARRYPKLANGSKRLYWLAIREDVIGNQSSLEDLRVQLKDHESELVQAMASLSDVRLLDVLAWSLSVKSGGPE